MPFDRAAARAEGYTEAEIDAYLAQRAAQRPSLPAAVAEAPAAETDTGPPDFEFTGEDEPIEPQDPIGAVLALASGRGIVMGAGRGLARSAARGVGTMLRGAPRVRPSAPAAKQAAQKAAQVPDWVKRIILRRIPLVGEELAGRVGKKAAGQVGSRAARKAARVVGKPKPEVGTAESRVMSAAEQAAARAQGRAIAPTASPGAMRGASGPALARRAAARARAVGTRPSAPPQVASEMGEALEQSLAVEQLLAQHATDPIERMMLRRLLREQGALP